MSFFQRFDSEKAGDREVSKFLLIRTIVSSHTRHGNSIGLGLCKTKINSDVTCVMEELPRRALPFKSG